MERRFELRLEELLEDAVLDPRIPEGMLDRLERFIKPYVAIMESPAQEQHLWEYVAGLFSDVKRKNAETIAYFHDQDRQALQKFIGQSLWDDGLLIEELSRQVGAELGESDGVLVFDPSAFRKQGKDSVGVARQWCGRYGKIDNCQVGIYLGYVSRKEHALVDVRLYLNKDWAKDKARRKKCGVPEEIRFQTRHALALEMLAEHKAILPHAWIAGDDEMGRSSAFRRDLRALGEQYLLAVPSNTLVRDLEAKTPEYSGRGPRPKVPFMRVDRWREALPENAWITIDVRDASWLRGWSGSNSVRSSYIQVILLRLWWGVEIYIDACFVRSCRPWPRPGTTNLKAVVGQSQLPQQRQRCALGCARARRATRTRRRSCRANCRSSCRRLSSRRACSPTSGVVPR